MPEQEGLENLNWFWKIIQSVLRSHAKNANLEFFLHKYPGLPAEIIAARRINTAARFAGLVGFASGAIISVASLTALASMLGTVATGFVGSPVTVPTMAVSLPLIGGALIAEVGLLTSIQLHLAYDLFVLHGLPVDVEDPERMQEVMQVAFGIKGVEVSGHALQRIIAQFAPQMLRKAMRTGLVRRKIQEIVARKLSWKFAKYLGEGFLIKALVPFIAVFTATWWDYTSTNAIGKTLQTKIRRRGLAVKEVEKLDLDQFDDPKLILQAVLYIALSSGGLSESELAFYSKLVETLRGIYGDEIFDSLNEVTSQEWDDVVAELTNITDVQKQEAIYKLLVAMVIVGGKLNRKNRQRLEGVAELYDIAFDKESIEARCKPFEEPRRSRTCLKTIIALFVFVTLMCTLTLFLLILLLSQ